MPSKDDVPGLSAPVASWTRSTHDDVPGEARRKNFMSSTHLRLRPLD